MSTRVRDVLMQTLGELRYEPTEKRIRATMGEETVVDTGRAMLVWEPRRIVPSYAVALLDLTGELAPAEATAAADTSANALDVPQLGARPVLDPSVPFWVRTTPGEPLVLRRGEHEAQAFRASDPALDGYVILDFDGFDAWYEEDERNVAHSLDPFHGVDIVHSSRSVRVELEGEVLAESSTPYLLFEPPLPVRCYLPTEDVRTELLQPSNTRTLCAYKGQAHYLSTPTEPDIAWTYPEPLRQAIEITGRIAVFGEHVDLVVDGRRLERPVTPWSRRSRS